MLKRLFPEKIPSGPIHVAYAADAHYGPYAGISIASVLRRFPWDWRDLHFHLLSDGVNLRDIERIKQMTATKGFTAVSVYDMRNWLRQDLPFLQREFKYLSRAAYSRFFLAEVLPRNINRVIYLDCDTLALGDVSELWMMTKETPVFAACPDLYMNAHLADHKLEIGMYPQAPYFNSGVAVLNLDAWRQGKIGANLIETAKKLPHCRFYEQDVLNSLLAEQTTQLPPIWNVQMSVSPMIDDARIVHFCGTRKPWQLSYDGAEADLFRNAKQDSPWRYMLPEFGIGRTVRRLQRSIAKRRAYRSRRTKRG